MSEENRSVDWSAALLLLAAFAAFGALVGYLVTFAMDEQYGARVEFEYPITNAAPAGFLREDRNLTTQVVMLGSRAVLEPVATTSGLTYDELADRTSATVVSTSEIVRLETRAASTDEAVVLAEAVSEGYLELTNGEIDRNLAFLRAQIAAVQRSLVAVDAPEVRQGLIDHRVDLQRQVNAIQLAGLNARVLTPAYALEDPVSPRRGLAALAGALSALIIGALLAAVLARRGSLGAIRALGDRGRSADS